ncbi:hypothetical protein C7B76_15875 [filamentous cyanobacterium CCP2]|nr:hypothetical protein C7B76_15875 [filamentous cyanobacterium CCP2]
MTLVHLLWINCRWKESKITSGARQVSVIPFKYFERFEIAQKLHFAGQSNFNEMRRIFLP